MVIEDETVAVEYILPRPQIGQGATGFRRQNKTVSGEGHLFIAVIFRHRQGVTAPDGGEGQHKTVRMVETGHHRFPQHIKIDEENDFYGRTGSGQFPVDQIEQFHVLICRPPAAALSAFALIVDLIGQPEVEITQLRILYRIINDFTGDQLLCFRIGVAQVGVDTGTVEKFAFTVDESNQLFPSGSDFFR